MFEFSVRAVVRGDGKRSAPSSGAAPGDSSGPRSGREWHHNLFAARGCPREFLRASIHLEPNTKASNVERVKCHGRSPAIAKGRRNQLVAPDCSEVVSLALSRERLQGVLYSTIDGLQLGHPAKLSWPSPPSPSLAATNANVSKTISLPKSQTSDRVIRKGAAICCWMCPAKN